MLHSKIRQDDTNQLLSGKKKNTTNTQELIYNEIVNLGFIGANAVIKGLCI